MENTSALKKDSDRIQVLPDVDVLSVIRQIIQTGYDDPFYVCDVGEIIRKDKEWKAVMPRIKTYYAVKCNNSRVVLETLAALGIGFDCASQTEIENVLSLGVHPSRINFANPTKKISHIQYAAEKGVSLMTFDCLNELIKIKQLHPSASLLIRIKCDDLSARYVLGKKFGCNIETEALELLRIAATLKLNVIGVCFHIGSSCKNHSVFIEGIVAARSVFDMAATVGYKFNLLDIGGGFPGDKGSSSIGEVAENINSAIEKYFPDPSINIISEPGRYFVNSAFTLASSIYLVKTINDVDPKTKSETKTLMYYTDVGVYGALIPVLFDEYFSVKPLNIKPNSQLYTTIIWGPTCDVSDKISEHIALPEMQNGDWIVFENVGAYTLSIACEFNGFPIPKLHSVIDEDSWLFLKETAPFPMSQDKFVSEGSLENFMTGLTGPNKFRTNYF